MGRQNNFLPYHFMLSRMLGNGKSRMSRQSVNNYKSVPTNIATNWIYIPLELDVIIVTEPDFSQVKRIEVKAHKLII